MPNDAKKIDLVRLMQKSVQVVEECLDSENDQIRFTAAKYVIDQVVGKPTQPTSDEEGLRLAQGTAAALAVAMRQLTAPVEQAKFDTIDGTIHILPDHEVTKGALNTSGAFEEFPE